MPACSSSDSAAARCNTDLQLPIENFSPRGAGERPFDGQRLNFRDTLGAASCVYVLVDDLRGVLRARRNSKASEKDQSDEYRKKRAHGGGYVDAISAEQHRTRVLE